MIKKSHAKVNIFLKIAGKRDGYHELVSRFVRVKNLYDEIEFVTSHINHFQLKGNFGCSTKSNTIYKAYMALKDRFSEVEEYFKHHSVNVKKRIPEFAGLGGGSSNAATFMLMVNEICNLCLTRDELAEIGLTIGADVPFFVYEYNSANVTGIGEVVKKFDERVLNIEVVTPKVKCDTGKIFKNFRENFYKEISLEESKEILEKETKTLTTNQSIYIPLGKKHRLENKEKSDLVLIEVQVGDYLEEDDIIRYNDDYNRV